MPKQSIDNPIMILNHVLATVVGIWTTAEKAAVLGIASREVEIALRHCVSTLAETIEVLEKERDRD